MRYVPDASSLGEVLLQNVEVYDQLAGKIESTFPLETLALHDVFLSHHRILDYGCGSGRAFQLLETSSASEIWGCDASPKMCELARGRNLDLNVLHLSNPKHPRLPAQHFDGVLLVGVLSSVVPLSERRVLVNVIAKCMRPRGTLVVGDFGQSNSLCYARRYAKAKLEAHTFLTREGLWIHHFSRDEIVALFCEHFDICSARTIPAQTIHGNSIPGHIVIARRKA